MHRRGFNRQHVAAGLRPRHANRHAHMRLGLRPAVRLDDADHDDDGEHDDGERERTLIESLLERRVRGLMIVPSGEDYSYLHLERKRGFAFTFVDRPAPYLDADAVLVDNQGGVAICIDELLSQGCKKIALIADNPSIWTAAERITGFKKAALSRKLRSENTLVITGIHNSQEAEAATHKLLEEEHIDAIIATNDLIAIGAGQVIMSTNSRCKVISFDDFDVADDVFLTAEVHHFLSLLHATDQ